VKKTLTVLFAAVIVLSLSLVPATAAAATPEGEGVQKDPPGRAIGRQPAMEQPGPGYTLHPPEEVLTGTWVEWRIGYLGSTSAETLEPYLDKVTVVEFTINGEPVENPEQYVVIYFSEIINNWSLSFRYKHPPLPPGEYTWSYTSFLDFNGFVWHRNAEGEFTVMPRGRR